VWGTEGDENVFQDDSIPETDNVEGVADLPVAEAQAQATTRATTRQSGVEQAAVTQSGKVMPTLAQRRKGGSKGGKTARHVALIGLGQPLPVVSLKSNADCRAVLEATLMAVAEGRTSGLVAATIVSIVRAAGELARHDQEEAIAALERRVAELVDSRVIRR
jgi:hypothetical protein